MKYQVLVYERPRNNSGGHKEANRHVHNILSKKKTKDVIYNDHIAVLGYSSIKNTYTTSIILVIDYLNTKNRQRIHSYMQHTPNIIKAQQERRTFYKQRYE